MDPASAMAGSIGIPPLNLSQGPTTLLTPSDGTQTSTNTGFASSGDFVFKGNQAGSAGASIAGLTPLLVIAGLGGVLWIAFNRLT